jgi:outer membrane protein, heavy metal efflux system
MSVTHNFGRMRLRLLPLIWDQLVMISFLLALVGCARFHSEPLSPTESAARFESRTLEDPDLRLFMERNLGGVLPQWPLGSWNFTNLVLAAFYYQPDLEVARAQWRITQAGKVTAAERPNPTVGVAPAYNTTTAIPSPWLVTATLDVPIETAGKRKYRQTQAVQLSEAARVNILSVAWQVQNRVRSSLVGSYAAQQTLNLLDAQQSIQTENLRLLELQHQAGAISAFDLPKARLAADNTRLLWRDAQRQNAEASAQLAEALGLPADALEHVKLAFDGLDLLPPEARVAEARRQALLNRSDILSALADYAASQSALQLEIAKQYPDVHLSPGYEFDQGDNKWSIGLSLTLPVLNQNRGGIAEALARRDESAAKFNALQARVLAEIDRAQVGYHAARQKQAEAETLMSHAQRQEKNAREMFAAGEISRSDLAALRLQLSASGIARLDALVKSMQALAQLEAALQSPLGLPPQAWENSPRPSKTGPTLPHP